MLAAHIATQARCSAVSSDIVPPVLHVAPRLFEPFKGSIRRLQKPVPKIAPYKLEAPASASRATHGKRNLWRIAPSSVTDPSNLDYSF